MIPTLDLMDDFLYNLERLVSSVLNLALFSKCTLNRFWFDLFWGASSYIDPMIPCYRDSSGNIVRDIYVKTWLNFNIRYKNRG